MKFNFDETRFPARKTDMKDERGCICPVVDIHVTRRDHVDEAQMRTIADMLNAMVALEIGDSPGPALYGKHRDDCPCRPQSQRGIQ